MSAHATVDTTSTEAAHEGHFESLEVQAHASRLGMWVFLASEMLLFAGLFVLYAALRLRFPQAFHQGVLHDSKLLGSLNTGLLLISSTTVALAAHVLREGKRRASAALVAVTMVLGAAFLVIKMTEYAQHFDDGIYPGGDGAFFATHRTPGLAPFFTLYFLMTGLHAVHMLVGLVILGTLFSGIVRGRIAPPRVHRMHVSAMYWHFIDLVWVFLWPLFYLAST